MYNHVNAGSYLFNKTDNLKNVQDIYLHKCKSKNFEYKNKADFTVDLYMQ